MKPLIGITVNYTRDDSVGTTTMMGGPNQEWNLLAQDYVKAIENAGGIPVLIPVYNHLDTLDELINKLDGILFSGGSDINPLFYGEEVENVCGFIISERDTLEIKLIKKIIEETDIPLLGICRGHQLLNIALGGTLYQDTKSVGLKDHMVLKTYMSEFSHSVKINQESECGYIFNNEEIMVNSFHHQSIKELGKKLEIVATSKDNIIEAISYKGRKTFTFAVQWHPETLCLDHSEHMSIFKEFIKSGAKQLYI